jgi:predicted nucleic acid-binding protein
MRLIDTSAWVEWLIASPTGRRVGELIPSCEDWLVPTMVQLELATWLTREAGEEKADQVIAFTQTCVVVPLDTRIALDAAELAVRHRLANADAIIYATALGQDADHVTCDAHFEGLPGVLYLPKSPG